MRVLGFDLSLARLRAPVTPAPIGRALPPPIVREPFTGAWQQNAAISLPNVFAAPPVFACRARISSDIAKVRLRLVQQLGAADIWQPTTNPAYSPVLRKPNHYQTTTRFLEQWVDSKLGWGNTYVLKRRDGRGVVDALYILQPEYVTPLVADDGAIYYELRRSESALPAAWADQQAVIVPAREMIHDRWNCLFHPLVGLSPLYAAALAATQGLTMQANATSFFGANSQPNGVLTVPGNPSKETLQRLQDDWKTRTAGIAVLSGDLKYQQLSISSVDAQFVEQLQFTTQQVAMVYGVPLVLLNADTGGQAYGKNEPIIQLYHDECLQPLMKSIEDCLDEGLELGAGLGTELDIDDLLWMDTTTRTSAAAEGVKSGVLTPNEARAKYFGLPPVPGGDVLLAQQQYFSLEAIAARDRAAGTPAPTNGTP